VTLSRRKTNGLLALAMLVLGCIRIRWTERLQYGGGLGWDGQRYAAWARDFYDSVFVRRIPEYYVQRMLPSGIVHYGMRLFHMPFTARSIIFAFDVFNLVALVVLALAWGAIADQLSVSTRGKWLGFALIIFNYAILKHTYYHSVLTDTAAFVLGGLAFYFYLSDRPIPLLATLVAGNFTWPIIAPFAAVLYVFPRRKDDDPAAKPLVRHGNVLVASLVAVPATAVLLYLMRPAVRAKVEGMFGTQMRINNSLLYLSIACTGLYLFFGLRTLLDDDRLFDLRRIFAEIRWPRVAIVVVLMLVLKVVQHALANGEPAWAGLKLFAVYTILTSITGPLLFLVAHVTYFGAGVLLLAFLWKPVSRLAGELGYGMQLFLLLAFIPSVNPQSRYGMNLVVTLFALVVVLMDRRGITLPQLGIVTVLALAWSKIWYTINVGPQVDTGKIDDLLYGPLQRYFQQAGTWMSDESFAIHAAATAATAIVLWLFVIRPHSRMRAAVTSETRHEKSLHPGGGVVSS
jgi:hypothetical protein